MRFILKAWLPLLNVGALGALAYLLVRWSDLTAAHKLSFVVTILLVLHINEEEWAPGGFAYLFNVLLHKSAAPDRYPMSPVIAMVVDVVVWSSLFLPALFFPHVIWLGLAPMFLAILESVTHGVLIGIVLQWRGRGWSPYNPGLVTAVLLAATGAVYIVVAVSDHLIGGLDWFWAVLYFIGTVFVGLVLPEQGFRSVTARWAFTPEQTLGYYRRYTTVEETFGGLQPAGAQ
ncbi:HXXEE domain-containing protein [Nocardia alni]|uniref:HXXEE domain-containing protein n=1 Tax=Nocardia alni TaxID=2815723 RepID=UPI001C21B875|nr:HXXEE domain-containing protein [Nocardia alni]